MTTASQKRNLFRPNSQAVERKALSIKHKPRPKRSYLDVGIGSVCLSGDDTGGAYCLLEASLAPGERRKTRAESCHAFTCSDR